MRVRHLSKTYTPESGEVKALNDVNFELPESGMVFILGKSGSGKSTKRRRFVVGTDIQ